MEALFSHIDSRQSLPDTVKLDPAVILGQCSQKEMSPLEYAVYRQNCQAFKQMAEAVGVDALHEHARNLTDSLIHKKKPLLENVGVDLSVPSALSSVKTPASTALLNYLMCNNLFKPGNETCTAGNNYMRMLYNICVDPSQCTHEEVPNLIQIHNAKSMGNVDDTAELLKIVNKFYYLNMHEGTSSSGDSSSEEEIESIKDCLNELTDSVNSLLVTSKEKPKAVSPPEYKSESDSGSDQEERNNESSSESKDNVIITSSGEDESEDDESKHKESEHEESEHEETEHKKSDDEKSKHEDSSDYSSDDSNEKHYLNHSTDSEDEKKKSETPKRHRKRVHKHKQKETVSVFSTMVDKVLGN